MPDGTLTDTATPPELGALTVSAAGDEHALLSRVEAELHAQAAWGLLGQGKEALGDKWSTIVAREPKRFIRDDLSLRAEVLRNFRRNQVFVSDYGSANLHPWLPRNWIDGARRGMRRRLIECLDTLKAQGDAELLRKYPCHPAGNPYVFTREGFRYTYRWHKHMHFLGLFNRILGSRLPASFTALDIGSSYGIFSYLTKSEYPKSRAILVDFPEQLLLAYYFLGRCFPDARIGGVRELGDYPAITAEALAPYDVVLLPCAWYERLAAGTVDIVTNFASLGEMPRAWFRYYLDGPAFTDASYLFTVNRFQSAPTYDTDVTILDYPVWDPAKRLYFGISPVFSHAYTRRNLVSYDRVVYASQYFEYIGRLR